MRYQLSAILVGMALTCSCLGSKFSPVSETASKPNLQSSNIEAAPKSEDPKPDPVVSEGLKLCAEAVGGDISNGIVITNESDFSQLQETSFLFFQLSSQTQLNVPDELSQKILGICVESRGGSSLEIDLAVSAKTLFYYGRGNATTHINLGSGVLDQVITDVSGSNSLELLGQNLQCDQLDSSQSSASSFVCNGLSQ